MKAYFSIGNYKDIPVIPEIKFADIMNGNPDSMSFSFPYDIDITNNVKIKEYCVLRIEDDIHKLIECGTYNGSTITIGEDIYDILQNNIYQTIDDNSVVVGALNYNDTTHQGIILIGKTRYTIDNTTVYLDNRKYYYMRLNKISCEKLSTKANNGYMITVMLKEETVLLKDCIRTDITVSPSQYPDGSNIFETLLDATFKVLDCHNMCMLNEQITGIDTDLKEALSNVACPELTYRDLSTYSQLYDIFSRIGRVPYFENGIIYGLSLQGTETNDIDLSKYSSVETNKEDGTNSDVYTIKSYNTLYDDEIKVVPEIFDSYVKNWNKIDGIVIGYANWAGKLTYPDTTRVFNSIDDVKQELELWVNQAYNSYLLADGNVNRKLLFVNGFNTLASDIEDARQYYLELPTNIETVEDIFTCKPAYDYKVVPVTIGGVTTYKLEASFYFIIDKVSEVSFQVQQQGTTQKKTQTYKRFMEQNFYNQLSSLQKRKICYYTRGQNRINNIVSLVAEDEDLQGDWKWSSSNLYNRLRQQFFVVAYKPMNTSTYVNYEYCGMINRDKPISVQNYNLPYKVITDKQIYPQLEYSLEKGSDYMTNIKIITTDTSILDLTAGDIVTYQGNKYIINSMSVFINNKTVECSFELMSKVISKSVVSSYKDNVRVSSNLSTDNIVDRSVHMLFENVVALSDHTLPVAVDASADKRNYDIRKLGSGLIMGTMANNNLFSTLYNRDNLEKNCDIRSQVPFKLNTINDVLRDENITTLTVALNTTSGLGNRSNYSFTNAYGLRYQYKEEFNFTPNIGDANNDFPVLAVVLKKYNDIKGKTYVAKTNEVSSKGVKSETGSEEYKLCYTPSELSNFVRNYSATANFTVFNKIVRIISKWIKEETSWPEYYYYLAFVKKANNNSLSNLKDELNTYNTSAYIFSQDRIEIRPPVWFENATVSFENDWVSNMIAINLVRKFLDMGIDIKDGGYMSYYGSGAFSSTPYINEYLFSTNGLISKIDYVPTTETYCSSSIVADTIKVGDIVTSYTKLEKISDAKIELEQPILYNTSTNGCVMQGVGDTTSTYQSISFLPNIYGKGLYVDIRERLKPYVQFKTIKDNVSTDFKISQLNSEFKWMNKIKQEYKIYNDFRIVKVNKLQNINNIEYFDYDDLVDNTYATLTNEKSFDYSSFSIGYSLNDGKKLKKDDDYDYVFIMTRLDENNNIVYSVPLIKFNIDGSNEYSKLYINTYITDSYSNDTVIDI